ncbi:MAG: DUF6465 family protein [Blautia massiliensis]|uniref:DUF6465 family protein n=1 Tax=Blautia massiliensis (ex Durand et al. 2017) TaxID=1737424 RepID=UPI002431FC27|nr:DUF6465 family protein [Blautia massiliensis (ex Durand et al. 2017)]MCI7603647.1 DUF6465 family protein [Blautia massiliensis (ex Durand et al. 2017)]
MARTKKAATKTTVKTASVSETPAKSVVTASEEKAVKAETPKTDDAKASVETKAAEKTAEVKPAAAKPVEEKAAEVKSDEEKTTAVKSEEPAKKTAAKKTTTRKTAAAKKTTTRTTAKTTAAKKAEPVTEVYVQYWGKEIHTSEVADRIKKIWTEDMGKKASELKELKIYIKPEDNGAHYVINGDVTGFIGL